MVRFLTYYKRCSLIWIIWQQLFYSRAAAPEIISINSRVMTAWRVRLNVIVNLSIISPEKKKHKKSSDKCKLKYNIWHTGVLAGVIHGRHTRRLLRGGVFLHAVIDERGHRVLQVRLQHIAVQGIVNWQFAGTGNGFCVENGHGSGAVRNHRTEHVEQQLSFAVIQVGVEDALGDERSITEHASLAADLSHHHGDVIGVRSKNFRKITPIVFTLCFVVIWEMDWTLLKSEIETLNPGGRMLITFTSKNWIIEILNIILTSISFSYFNLFRMYVFSSNNFCRLIPLQNVADFVTNDDNLGVGVFGNLSFAVTSNRRVDGSA